MKSSLLALLLPAVASARFIEATEANHVIPYPDELLGDAAEKFLVELSPGETKWVTEEEKWELRRVSIAFL
jgi:bacterial leucyl aminopeptidase